MKQKGFTLVEALVSISIIVILAGITLANYADIRTATLVGADVDLVVGALRTAQAEALAPERSNFKKDDNPEPLGDSDRLCSIGVRFNVATNQLQPVFRSINPIIGDCSSPSVSSSTYGEGIVPEFSVLSGSEVTVYFDAPFGGRSAASTAGAGDVMEIRLQSNQDDSLIRTISIYPSGIIETQ